VAAPTFVPVGGTFNAPFTAVIETATPGATIFYTTDGTTPSPSSTKYTAPVPVSKPATTINAIATKSGDTESSLATTIFTIAPAAIATTTTLQSSLNPSPAGQSVTLTATVAAASGPTPTGSVTFKSGSTVLGTVPLSGGVALFSTAGLAAGLHNFGAVNMGTATDAHSSSPALAQHVSP